jgi:plastocyanin
MGRWPVRTAAPGTVADVPNSPLTRLLAGGCLLLAAAGLAGCQRQGAINREPHTGSSTATVSDGVQQVTLTTDQQYRFSPSTITVHPGKVRITLTHLGTGAPHDWSLDGFPADYVPLVTPGQTRSVDFTAPAPGKYTFVCTIHVAQGQTGTLIVLPN